MIMNMIKTSEVIKIFLKYNITNLRDESKYKISKLEGITNTSYLVDVNSSKFVLRIPGKNPDVINRVSEKINTTKAQDYGLTLPYLIFDENTGIKISEYFDLYTYKSSDFENENLRNKAFRKLFDLHSSDLLFADNFSPLDIFSKIADVSNEFEKEVKEIGDKIVDKITEIGIEYKPCHQDLYFGNFVIHQDETYLIDWEYSAMGDVYFDYADLFWQNEFDLNKSLRNKALEEIGVLDNEKIEKFEYFEILSMITWGLWALKRSSNDENGMEALNKALDLFYDKKL